MGNEAWVLPLNVAGLAPFIPGSSVDKVPTGPYMCQIDKTEQVEKKGGGGCDNIVFHLSVEEPAAFKGKKLRIYMPVDPNVGEGMIGRKWHNILVATAKKPEAVDQGGVTLKADFFKGKKLPVYVQEQIGKDDKGRDLLANIDPIEPSTYAKFKAEGGPGAAGAIATGAQTSGGAMQVTGGAPGTTPNGSAAPRASAEVSLD